MMIKLFENIQHIDIRAIHWCINKQHIALIPPFVKGVSRTADGHLYLLLAAILWFMSFNQVLYALLAAYSIERVTYFVLKNSFKRNRPAQALSGFESIITPSDKFSLPSGHTSAAFLTACYLTYIAPIGAPLYFLWAILVGLSRVFLGVHFPTDILIGALLGSFTALLTIQYLI